MTDFGVWKKIKLSLLILIGFFVLLDISARLITVIKHRDINKFFYINNFYAMFQFPKNYVQLNPFLVIQPGTNPPFNREGYRSKHSPYTQKKKNQIRIFALGGSTTANARLPVSYTELLGEKLDEEITDYEVQAFNAGQGAYSTNQSLVRLATDIVHFEPDIITVMHTNNDIHELFFTNVESLPLPRNAKYFHPRYFRFLARHKTSKLPSFYKNILSNRLLNKHRAINIAFGKLSLLFEEDPFRNQVLLSRSLIEKGAKEYRRNLLSMVALARSVNAEMVFISQPIYYNEKIYYSGYERVGYDINYPYFNQYREIHDSYTRAMCKVAQKTDCYYIPMKEYFESTSTPEKFFRDLMHYTEDGIEKFAELAFPYLLQVVQEYIAKRSTSGHTGNI